jgi:hypothetical protein
MFVATMRATPVPAWRDDMCDLRLDLPNPLGAHASISASALPLVLFFERTTCYESICHQPAKRGTIVAFLNNRTKQSSLLTVTWAFCSLRCPLA